jgi:hypothetical protein
MIEHGVKRVGRCDYRCAKCGADVSDVFLLLAVGDEHLADELVEKGGNDVK